MPKVCVFSYAIGIFVEAAAAGCRAASGRSGRASTPPRHYSLMGPAWHLLISVQRWKRMTRIAGGDDPLAVRFLQREWLLEPRGDARLYHVMR